MDKELMDKELMDKELMDKELTDKELTSETDKKEVKKQKKKHNRCDYCNVKLGLIFFTCKCEKNYCHKHLNPHSHGCLFDNRQACRNAIRENNPQMKTNTLNKV